MVPQAGDLLVTRSNTPAYIGDVAAVTRLRHGRMLPDLDLQACGSTKPE